MRTIRFLIKSPPTFAGISISRKTGFASATIRSQTILAVSVHITNANGASHSSVTVNEYAIRLE